MPTYEFRCPKGHEFEKFYRSMSAAQLQVPCPTCGKTAERQMSAGAGLVFKGAGFYITDYGKDGKKGAPTPAGSGETKSESTPKSDAPSSDVKPAKESKPAASTPAEKPASGKKKTNE